MFVSDGPVPRCSTLGRFYIFKFQRLYSEDRDNPEIPCPPTTHLPHKHSLHFKNSSPPLYHYLTPFPPLL
jgi:hypothetical protein